LYGKLQEGGLAFTVMFSCRRSFEEANQPMVEVEEIGEPEVVRAPLESRGGC
jgi:hypothetical protein